MTKGEVSNMVVFILAIVVLLVVTGSMVYVMDKLQDMEMENTSFGAQIGEGKTPIANALVKIDIIKAPEAGGSG
jgi:cell division protein FtsL